jgi:hypothetical protein
MSRWNEALARLGNGEDLADIADEYGYEPEKLVRAHGDPHPKAKKNTLADLVFWRARRELRTSDKCAIVRDVESTDYTIIPGVSIDRFLADPNNRPRFVLTVTRETSKERIAEEIA